MMIVEATANAKITASKVPSHRADYEQKIAAAKRMLLEAGSILSDALTLTMGGIMPRSKGGHDEAVSHEIQHGLNHLMAQTRGNAGFCDTLSGAKWRPLLKMADDDPARRGMDEVDDMGR